MLMIGLLALCPVFLVLLSHWPPLERYCVLIQDTVFARAVLILPILDYVERPLREWASENFRANTPTYRLDDLPPDLTRWLHRIEIALFFWIGACLGSFLNVVVHRWPRGLALSWPPSACPRCHHPIRPWHNIPILGWLFIRGRCADCQAPVSLRYPLTELFIALLFGILAFLFLDLPSIGPERHRTYASSFFVAMLACAAVYTLIAFLLVRRERAGLQRSENRANQSPSPPPAS